MRDQNLLCSFLLPEKFEEEAICLSLLALALYQAFAREVLCICDQDGSELLCMIDYYTKQHMNMHTATYTKGIQMSELQ
jgi:hypothetical protein